MTTPSDAPLDIREQIARIDHILADRHRIDADINQKNADRDRRRQEIKYQPWIAAISGMTAGAALLAAGAALMKIFGG